ncbi:unnamed protein product [Prorocentrum cordatum]|uniref:Glucosidase II beta subunit N-terminal domain-containing protein n=1 Tax=Prorocentrum cordatum TaxID=2364126 RepID=A0ABN9VB98_9DINO|nr:unnamed protein product [Polarella glacialis]
MPTDGQTLSSYGESRYPRKALLRKVLGGKHARSDRFLFLVDCQPLQRIVCGHMDLLNNGCRPVMHRIVDNICEVSEIEVAQGLEDPWELQLTPLGLALAGLASAANLSPTLGVAPADAAKYSGKTFKCTAGVPAKEVTLPASAVNDLYCDCPDGSDEPGTGACAGQEKTLFFCPNKGSTARTIYASRVGDGICDCCDGSDEAALASLRPALACKNVCAEQGAREKEEMQRRMDSLKRGVAKREEIAAQAVNDRKTWQKDVERLQAELPDIEKFHEEAKAVADAERKKEDEAREAKRKLEEEENKDCSPACMWRQTGGCKPDGEREEAKDKTCTSTIPKGSSGFCDCDGDGVKAANEIGFDCAGAERRCCRHCKAPKDGQPSAAAAGEEAKEEKVVSEYTKWMDGAEKAMDKEEKDVGQPADTLSRDGAPPGDAQAAEVDRSGVVGPAGPSPGPTRGAKCNVATLVGEFMAEVASACATLIWAEVTKEEKVVSEYTKWMDGAEAAMGDEKAEQVAEETGGKDPQHVKKLIDTHYRKGIVWFKDTRVAEWDDKEKKMILIGDAQTFQGKLDELMKHDFNVDPTPKVVEAAVETGIKNLQKKIEAMSDDHLGYASLAGKTLSRQTGEFEYKVAFFDSAKQGSTSLGRRPRPPGAVPGRAPGASLRAQRTSESVRTFTDGERLEDVKKRVIFAVFGFRGAVDRLQPILGVPVVRHVAAEVATGAAALADPLPARRAGMAPSAADGAASQAARVEDPAAALRQLSDALQQLAPRLAPVPFAAPPAALALGRLYGADCGKELRGLEDSSSPCSICGADREESAWSMDWSADCARRSMSPLRCALVCGPCGKIRDLPRLVERLTRQLVPLGGQEGAAAQDGDALLQHFLRVNGHDAAEVHKLQDAVSVAHAMMVIHKELRLKMLAGPELQDLLGRSPRSDSAVTGKRAKEPARAGDGVRAGGNPKKRRKPGAA